MAKYFGKIGYGIPTEDRYGVVQDVIVERSYYGDIVRNYMRYPAKVDGVNDDVDISNNISIVADPYAYEHIANMRYVNYMGSRWKVNSVEIKSPRLEIGLGGVYNGPTIEDGQINC